MRSQLVIVDPQSANPATTMQQIAHQEVKEARRKDKKRARNDDGLETISELNVVSTLGAAQQSLVGLLNPGPLDDFGVPIVYIDVANGFDAAAAALLKWTANGVRTLAITQYNAITALRAEALIHFLDHGLRPKRNGLFGGSLKSLLVLGMLGNGTFGLNGLFGGAAQPPYMIAGSTFWGGIIAAH